MDLFRDEDVQTARENGGVVCLPSGRRVLLPPVFGFCGGVVRALQLLQDWTERHGEEKIHLLGPVIHNDTVNDAFRDAGVNILPEDRIREIFRVAERRDLVVLPAFGIPLDVEQQLRKLLPAEQILDTTCRYVRRVWAFLYGLSGDDWTVLVHGKAGHPETRATVSRARDVADTVLLVPTPVEAAAVCQAIRARRWDVYPAQLRLKNTTVRPGPIAVVNQTTMLYDETVAIAREVTQCATAAGLNVRLADTVCRATQERQNAARQVCAQHPDVMIVIGGFTSSNTAQLHRLALSETQAYFIDSAKALGAHAIRHYQPGLGVRSSKGWLPVDWQSVGILAGASCPMSDIGDVIRRLRELDEEL